MTLVIRQLQIMQMQQNHESERPLDHAKATMLKPLYRTQCPKVSSPVDCRLASTKMVMLNAHPKDQRPEASVVSRNNISFSGGLELYNTTELNHKYSIVKECKTTTRRNRLFAVYRHVFRDVLARYPEE